MFLPLFLLAATLYTTGPGNRLVVSRVGDNGNLEEQVQAIDEIVDPLLPDGLDVSEEEPGQKFATEWVSHHPKFPLVFALTSFWDRAEAMLTTFRVNERDGTLTKLSSCKTGGFQACQGVFSADGSTYVVPHHEGGMISLFDVSQDAAPEGPVQLVQIPEFGDKTGEKKVQISCHGACYGPGDVPKYLLAVDPMQDIVLTYPCDAKGRIAVEQPSSFLPVKFAAKTGWVQLRFFRALIGTKADRPRRAVVHPNGKYVYVLSELVNSILVFPIDENGVVSSKECLQELKITKVDKGLFGPGLGVTASAEMQATDTGILVSVRGLKLFGQGRCESGIYIVDYAEGDGSKLRLGSVIPITGSIRHFWKQQDELWVGVENAGDIQKYKLERDEEHNGKLAARLLGECSLDMKVMCIASKPL